MLSNSCTQSFSNTLLYVCVCVWRTAKAWGVHSWMLSVVENRRCLQRFIKNVKANSLFMPLSEATNLQLCPHGDAHWSGFTLAVRLLLRWATPTVDVSSSVWILIRAVLERSRTGVHILTAPGSISFPKQIPCFSTPTAIYWSQIRSLLFGFISKLANLIAGLSLVFMINELNEFCRASWKSSQHLIDSNFQEISFSSSLNKIFIT